MPNSVSRRKASEVVAESIRVARARKQLTQREVAEKAGLVPGKISQLESGISDPRLSTLERVARALDLEISLAASAA